MAGHSHFANIMRIKARVDARRGKAFSKISRLLQAAVRTAGPNPRDNLRLQFAIDKAKAANMPKDTIQRIIDKNAGGPGSEDFHEVTYEAYGPGGVAILIESLTDNRNRTAPEVKTILDRNNGRIGNSGSVAWMFERKGIIEVPVGAIEEDALFELALDAGAEDIVREGTVDEDERYVVTTGVVEFQAVKKAITEAGIEVSRADFEMIPTNTVDADETVARKVMKLQSLLEDNDDVQTVTTNMDVSEEVAAKLAQDG